MPGWEACSVETPEPTRQERQKYEGIRRRNAQINDSRERERKKKKEERLLDSRNATRNWTER